MDIIKPQYRREKNPFGDFNPNHTYSFRVPYRNIHVYPDTHHKEKEDIGWIQLIKPDKTPHLQGIEDIIDNFPSIKIHECVQETKIASILNSIGNLVDGFKLGQDMYEKAKASGSLGLVGKYIAQAVTSNTFMASLTQGYKSFDSTKLKEETALKLTYALQYCLMNREYNNTYELPYASSQLYQTNGTDGWKNEVSEFGGTSSNSLLGKALNFVGSQIRLISEPIWQGTSQQSQTQIQVKVNLFNDNINSALANFIFIHNIIPNNMYLQYGMLQQAPSYYDVNIEGNRRFPLCKGSFKCDGKGIFRLIDIDNLNPGWQYFTDIKKICKESEHKLRIPDVYELELNLQSLLPDSFNDFLYYWYLKESDMKPVTKSSFDEEIMKGNFKAIADHAKNKYINTPEKDVQSKMKEITDKSGKMDEEVKTIEGFETGK